MRISVNMLMNADASAAPRSAFCHGTPTTMNGGAMRSVRAIVQPRSRVPLPFFFSRTSATVP
jgi:hypothetical protein